MKKKELLKIAVFSSLPNVRDEVINIFENPQREFESFYFHARDLNYEIFIEEMIKITTCTDHKKAQERQFFKDLLIQEFMHQICIFNPHFILFGPMNPCGLNELDIIKGISKNIDIYLASNQKKPDFIIEYLSRLFPKIFDKYLEANKNERPKKSNPTKKHSIKFIPIFMIKNYDYKEKLNDINCCLLDLIGDSLSKNINIITNYFHQLDKDKTFELEENKIGKNLILA